MRKNKTRRKAVSTIIAAIFILATLLAFLLAFTLIMQQMATTTSNVIRANQLLLKKQQEKLTINAVTITGTSVTITVTNDGTQPIILVAYIIRNNTVKIVGKITPEKYIPPQTKTTVSITTPQPLSPASTYEITLISKLGNAFKATYPIPTTNTTTLPGAQATLANTYLPRTAGPGTVTWAGTAIIPTPQTRAGNVTSYITSAGTATGLSTNLNLADTNNVTATSTSNPVIILTNRTAKIFDDFTTNPLGTELKVNSGTWVWYPTGYIKQTNSTAYTTGGGDVMVVFNKVLSISSSDKVYCFLKMNISNIYYTYSIYGYTGYGEGDCLLLANTTHYYMLGTGFYDYYFLFLSRKRLFSLIYYYNGSTYPISRNYISVSSLPFNEWMKEFSYREYSTGAMNESVFSSVGNISVLGTDNNITPIKVGLGTYTAAVAFDDVVVTVNGIPYFVNVTGLPSTGRYNVTLYNSTGYIVATTVKPVGATYVSLNVFKDPIVRGGNITIYSVSGSGKILGVYATKVFPDVVGGDVYSLKYSLDLVGNSKVDLTGVVKVASTSVGITVESNVTTTAIDVYAYNWATGLFDEVYSGTYAINVNVSSLSEYYVNPVNGTAILKMVAYDNEPFALQVDCLNVFPSVLIRSTQDVLLVGDGGTSYVDVFKLSGGAPGTVALTYWESIYVPGVVFNGSVDITYDNYVTYSLLMVNGSGVYKLDLLNPSAPPVFITSACRASGSGGARAEVVHDPASGKTYLVVLPGVGNQSFCVYNLTAYSSGGAWLISFASRGLNVTSPYTVSAVVGDSMYTILQNITSKAAVLVSVNPFTNTTFVPPSNTANFMPGLSNVGLAYDGTYLWLMLEGGSLYKVSPAYANFTNVPVLLLPAPIGYGDRMEYYNDALILVRDSGSSEIWVIPIS